MLCPGSRQHISAWLCTLQPVSDSIFWPQCFLTIQKPSLSASMCLSHGPALTK